MNIQKEEEKDFFLKKNLSFNINLKIPLENDEKNLLKKKFFSAFESFFFILKRNQKKK